MKKERGEYKSRRKERKKNNKIRKNIRGERERERERRETLPDTKLRLDPIQSGSHKNILPKKPPFSQTICH